MSEIPSFEQLELPFNQEKPRIPEFLANKPESVEAAIHGHERAQFDLDNPSLQQIPLPRSRTSEERIDYTNPEEIARLRSVAMFAVMNQEKEEKRAELGSRAKQATQSIDPEAIERGVPIDDNKKRNYQGRSDAALRRLQDADRAESRRNTHGRGPGF